MSDALAAKLAATGDGIAAWVEATGPERLRAARTPDGWSATDVLAHLLQAELVYGVRLGMVLTTDRPAIAAYDQDAWVHRLGPLDADPDTWLPLHRTLRARTVALLEGVADEEWDRVGIHEERGEESVRTIAEHLVHHDEEHLAQLQSLV